MLVRKAPPEEGRSFSAGSRSKRSVIAASRFCVCVCVWFAQLPALSMQLKSLPKFRSFFRQSRWHFLLICTQGMYPLTFSGAGNNFRGLGRSSLPPSLRAHLHNGAPRVWSSLYGISSVTTPRETGISEVETSSFFLPLLLL